MYTDSSMIKIVAGIATLVLNSYLKLKRIVVRTLLVD